MPVLMRIAIRNLFEHRGKTLIIGVIISVGVVVLIIGNALMDTAALGIQRSFIDNYTGHVMISGRADGEVSLFGVQSVGGIEPTPTIPDYPRVMEIAGALPQVQVATSQLTGFGLLRLEQATEQDTESSTFTLLFGIDPETYQRAFSNIRLISGSYLQPGQRGVMLSTDRVAEIEEAAAERIAEAVGSEQVAGSVPTTVATADSPGASPSTQPVRLSVGDEVRVVGFGSGLPRIRVVPIVGIYEQANEAEGVGSELITFVDAQTLRALLELTIAFQGEFDLTADATALLNQEFSDTDAFSDDIFGDIDIEAFDATASPAAFDEESLLGILGDNDREIQRPEIDSGAWHYILLRLNDGRQDRAVVAELNRRFAAAGMDVVAGNWEKAAGPFAQTADVIRTVFNIAVIVIGVVALFIMMNTMVISVIERTGEIGTMRALGAQKTVVWKMFMFETLVVSLTFGMIGVALGLAGVGILNVVGIEATNTFLQVLFAGPVLRPRASVVSLAASVAIVTVIGLLAHLYPVSVALKIQPVRAMQTE